MFFQNVCNALNKAKIPYAIVGGYAVALHGAVRGTVDIDIVINWTLQNLEETEKTLKTLGLVSRLPIDAKSTFYFRDEYIKNRNLIAWNFYDPRDPLKQVDIIINYNLKEGHTKTITRNSVKIKILAKEDLIAMKMASARIQDLADVEALKNL